MPATTPRKKRASSKANVFDAPPVEQAETPALLRFSTSIPPAMKREIDVIASLRQKPVQDLAQEALGQYLDKAPEIAVVRSQS